MPAPVTVTIRRASPADAAAIATLAAGYWEFESLAEFDAARAEALLRPALEDPTRALCWLAEADSTPVGYLLAVLVFSLEHGGTIAEIDEFFVVARHRGSGVGASLLAAAETALRRVGARRLQLQLGVDNVRGRLFYERAGFAGRRDFELWDKPL